MGERASGNLAATRLQPPSLPSRLVERSRLTDAMTDATASRVPMVLVSAPAGSGKSTLVAGWAASASRVAWLQLEEADADPARFWVSVIAAIGRTDPSVAEVLTPVVRGSLGAGQVVVPALVNELATMDDRLVLVLDDYHLVDEPEVHRGVERLVELCPDQLTIVLVTRADPPFRLGRMRVGGRVREIRAVDLRFEREEAAALLGAAARGLDELNLDALCERTEGWAAGLVLAGLSLERSGDATRFVETFRGDDHLIADYLTDEFLAALEPSERRRVVEAAVLHRLSGPLLDEVTGSTDGTVWLDALAERNQLVIRLDGIGEWYRYHHLFRDMLLLEARRSMPERLADLNRKAADWFERSGYSAAAVDHLLAAGDRERAMQLMRTVGPDLLGTGRLRTLRTILERLADGGPLDAICSMLSGWDHYLRGRYGSARELLDQATATLPDDIDPMRTMPLRINLALGEGDVAAALSGARAVLDAGALDARPSELLAAVGAALAWAGLPDDARTTLAVARTLTVAEGRVTAHAMTLVAGAIVEFQAGSPDSARQAAEVALEFARTSGLGDYHGMAPALAVRAATTQGAAAVTDAKRSVVLARSAATMLGLLFALTVAGDVLAGEGSDAGSDLLREAGELIGRCADPGISRALLDRAFARHRAGRPRPGPAAGTVEQLSDRELAVLRYLPSVLSLPEIARELYVSPNTVKSQCSAIYRKLGVTSRAAAVETARQHGVL